MNIDRIIMLVLGVLVLISAILAHTYSTNWLWLTGIIGVHMIQLSFTGFCLVAKILKKAGIESGKIF